MKWHVQGDTAGLGLAPGSVQLQSLLLIKHFV